MWWWLPGAMAATVQVVVPSGEARVGRPVLVQVAVAEERGWPEERPRLESREASLLPVEGEAGPGVWSWAVLPQPGVEELHLSVEASGQTWTHTVPVRPPPEARIHAPSRLTASTSQRELILSLGGEGLHPEDVGVVIPDGELLGIEPEEGGLRLHLDPGMRAGARVVPVGIWDRRRDSRPVWTSILIRERLDLSYRTEPGTTLEISVGSRSYGPFVADEEGRVQGWIDHYPGERLAEAVFTDSLGNFTRTPLPLSGVDAPVLTPLITTYAGERTAYLHALTGDGRAWTGRPPSCQTPVGVAAVAPVEPGTWVVSLPLDTEPGALPVECALGREASTSFRVEASPEAERSLRMQVWPEELSADFPVADVAVSLEDARGERLPVEGVSVHADAGEVVLQPVDARALVLRGEYRGYEALDERPVSEDVIRAELSLPQGEGPVVALRVAHGAVPREGQVLVHGRALDASGRPIEGVSLTLGAGADEVSALTDARGWASAVVGLPEGEGPVVLEVRAGSLVRRGLALRGAPAWGGPAEPDLQATRSLRIVHGRVSEIRLGVPAVLFSGGRAASILHITLLDRTGQPITDTWPAVSAELGEVEGLRLGEDGGFLVFYTPPAGERDEVDTITAVAEGRSASAQLQLQVRPVRRAPGLGVGVLSNLGGITSPWLTADVDVRTSLLSDTIMLRLGVSWYQSTATEEEVRIREAFLPLTVGLAARRDPGRSSQWLGMGVSLAPTREEVWYGGEHVSSGLGILPPGFMVFGGAGLRIPGGELFAELRVLSLTDPGGEASFKGLVGGVGAVAGYRVPF